MANFRKGNRQTDGRTGGRPVTLADGDAGQVAIFPLVSLSVHELY